MVEGDSLNQKPAEATIETSVQGGGSESTCNNAESVKPVEDREKSLEFADELMEKGSKAAKDNDYVDAAEFYSRALEIRVSHFGELSPQCVNTYYKYGCALLYKAQDEADPLVSVPKKEDGSEQDSKKDVSEQESEKDGCAQESTKDGAEEDSKKDVAEQESKKDVSEQDSKMDVSEQDSKMDVSEQDSKMDVSEQDSKIDVSEQDSKKDGSEQEKDASEQESKKEDGSAVSVTNEKNTEQESDDSDDDDDLAEGEEDDSDLDLAWKMLDVARAIVEKHSGDTMEKVDILSALAEIALEREDVETSLSDYLKALEILERLVEPDSRFIAELNFRICLCLEIASKPQDAIPYCQKAISICKSRVQRLSDEIKNFSGSSVASEASGSAKSLQRSFSTSASVDSVADKEAEIETLTGLASELDKKLEDLQQLVSQPSFVLADILKLVNAKAEGANKSDATCDPNSSQMGTANSSGDVDSSTVSTAHTQGTAAVTHLGVVGRGVKRVNLTPETQEPAKKPALDPSLNNGGDGSAL